MSEIRVENDERIVVSIKEIWEGRIGGIDEFGNRHYTRVWNVLVNNVTADVLEVTAAPGLPARFSHYGHPSWPNPNGAVDEGATLRRYEGEQLPEGVHWRITAYYDSTPTQTKFDYNPNDYGGVGGFNTGDPLEQTPIGRASQIQFGTLRYLKAFIKRDLDGKPIVASNGQRFDPPLVGDRAYITFQVTRNENNYALQTALDFVDRVNDGNWVLGGALGNFIIGDGLAKCEAITSISMVEQGIFFYRVTYSFLINPNKKDDGSYEGWQPELLDVGTYQWGVGPNLALIRKPILDRFSSVPITSPVVLDGSGAELQPTNTGSLPPVFDYTNSYRSFRVYEKKNFNLLALP